MSAVRKLLCVVAVCWLGAAVGTPADGPRGPRAPRPGPPAGDAPEPRPRRFEKLDNFLRKITTMVDVSPDENGEYVVTPINSVRVTTENSSTRESESLDDYPTTKTPEHEWPGNADSPLAREDYEKNADEIDRDDDFLDEYDENDMDYEDDENEEQVRLYQQDEELDATELMKHYIMSNSNGGNVVDDDEQEDDHVDDLNSDDCQDMDEGCYKLIQADGTSRERKWTIHAARERPKPINSIKNYEVVSAARNLMKMKNEGRCKIPQKRTISLHSLFPNPSKSYTPHCALLHRCGDDVGCCESDRSHCIPKKTETVELYFYTSKAGHAGKTVEKLSFINHTECHCVERRPEFMFKDETSIMPLRRGPSLEGIFHDAETEAPSPFKLCKCPAEYSQRILDNGNCECDCISRRKDCMRIKRGKEYFSMKDRLCILHEQCHLPACEFGVYMGNYGRCPRRLEKINDSSRH